MSAAGGRLNWLAVAQIPLVDVKAQYAPLLEELKERIAEVLDSGRFILGPNVRAFEEEAAAYLGVKHAIGVANGTDALVLALDALGIGEGDEVICPTFTFYATAEAIARRGAAPVFVDIDPQTMNLDASDVRRRMTAKTKAIMPVHLFGRPAPLEELAELGVPLVEDAAQAFGAQGTGRAGIVSTYSFFPTKNLFAFGDGGLVSTDDDELAERLRLLRFHGSKAKKEFELIGYNSRLDEIQAAVLRVFLPHLEEWNRSRREAAARYAELVSARSASCRPTSPATSTTSSSSARPSATGSPSISRPPGSPRPSTTRRRSTGSLRSPIWGRPSWTFPRPSAPRGRTSRFRCGPGSAPTCRNRSSQR